MNFFNNIQLALSRVDYLSKFKAASTLNLEDGAPARGDLHGGRLPPIVYRGEASACVGKAGRG